MACFGALQGLPRAQDVDSGHLLQILELGRHGERGRVTEEEVSLGPGGRSWGQVWS